MLTSTPGSLEFSKCYFPCYPYSDKSRLLSWDWPGSPCAPVYYKLIWSTELERDLKLANKYTGGRV